MRARLLNESLFHGRQITVLPKRKNIPGSSAATAAGLRQTMMMMPLLARGGGRGGRGGGVA